MNRSIEPLNGAAFINTQRPAAGKGRGVLSERKRIGGAVASDAVQSLLKSIGV